MIGHDPGASTPYCNWVTRVQSPLCLFGAELISHLFFTFVKLNYDVGHNGLLECKQQALFSIHG
jgi:hypothetical protein